MSNTYYRDYDDTLDPKSANVKTDWKSVLFDYKGIKKYRDDIHDEVFIILLLLSSLEIIAKPYL